MAIKELITQDEYFQLVGLKTLGNERNKELELIANSFAKVLGVDDETFPVTDDYIHDGDSSIEDMLNNIGVEVEDAS